MKRKNHLLRVLSLLLCVVLLAGCSRNQQGETTESPAGYEELAGVYLCNLSVEGGMSVKMYLQIGPDASFVFSRSPDFSSREKGAGILEKNEEGKDVFSYEIVRDESVEKGSHTAAFEITPEGGIQFTSLMWFGSATPRFIAEDESVTYPVFMPYDESMDRPQPSETAEASTAASASVPAVSETVPETTLPPQTETAAETRSPETQEQETTPAVETQPEPTQPPQTTPAATEPAETEPLPTEEAKPEFREGTYTGTMDKYVDAMESDIHYDITLTLSGGSYTYQVAITLSGKLEYSNTEVYTGTYTVDGMSLTMTGTLKSATANTDGSLTVTGVLSSFAGSSDTVTLYQ